MLSSATCSSLTQPLMHCNTLHCTAWHAHGARLRLPHCIVLTAVCQLPLLCVLPAAPNAQPQCALRAELAVPRSAALPCHVPAASARLAR